MRPRTEPGSSLISVGDIHPENVTEMLLLVRRWGTDHATWDATGSGPDGTRFPPKWPLTYVETAGLIEHLANRRDSPVAALALLVEACERGEPRLRSYLDAGHAAIRSAA